MLKIRFNRNKFISKKIRANELLWFTQQLIALLSAGFPITRALQALIENQKNTVLSQLISKIKLLISNGASLSQALSNHPKIFDAFYCKITRIGEEIGDLETMLAYIADHQKTILITKQKIKQACIYPSIVLIVAILIGYIILVFVVPQFQTLFKNFNANLPLPTLLLIQLSKWLQFQGWKIFVVPFLIYWFCKKLNSRYPRIKYFWKLKLLRFPIIGKLYKVVLLQRFFKTMAITYKANLAIGDCLQLANETAMHPKLTQISKKAAKGLKQGKKLSQALNQDAFFPTMILQMLKVAEESSQLNTMLDTIANHYQTKINSTIENLQTIIEPLLMVFLGATIGSLMIAMYLPIFKLGSIV